jgi:hypothetical protein
MLHRIEKEFNGAAVDREATLRSYLCLWLIEARHIAEGSCAPLDEQAASQLTWAFLLLVEQQFGDWEKPGATLLPSAPHRWKDFACLDTNGKMCFEGVPRQNSIFL